MTKVHTWTMTGLAVIALAVGALLATGAISSAQSPTPTPSATEDAGDDGTPIPSPSDEDSGSGEDDTQDEATPDDRRTGCGGGGKFLIKEAAAEVLGISEGS
jgi:hypothetical protein